MIIASYTDDRSGFRSVAGQADRVQDEQPLTIEFALLRRGADYARRS